MCPNLVALPLANPLQALLKATEDLYFQAKLHKQN